MGGWEKIISGCYSDDYTKSAIITTSCSQGAHIESEISRITNDNLEIIASQFFSILRVNQIKMNMEEIVINKRVKVCADRTPCTDNHG